MVEAPEMRNPTCSLHGTFELICLKYITQISLCTSEVEKRLLDLIFGSGDPVLDEGPLVFWEWFSSERRLVDNTEGFWYYLFL